MAMNNHSPSHMLTRSAPEIRPGQTLDKKQMVPDVHSWSDVKGILWPHYCREHGGDPSTLSYIYRQNIITPDAKRMIDEAAGRGINQPRPTR